MKISVIAEQFGGTRPMARTLGHATHTTVQGWIRRGVIPARRQREVLQAAHAIGIPLQPADLLPIEGDVTISTHART